MKMGKIVEAVPALQKLANTELTPKTLYWVSKLMSKLDKELAFFNTQRERMLSELGTQEENGNWSIPPESRPVFEERMTELLNIDIEDSFKIVLLPMSENVSLSYNDLTALSGLVELNASDIEDSN